MLSPKRFPLPVSPFRPLMLSQPDETAIANIANDFLVATLVDYEMLHIRDGGVMNPSRWKPVKRFENLTAYRERNNGRKTSNVNAAATDPHPRLVWRGVLDGKLDDVMYGVVNQTEDAAKIKGSYVKNNVVDEKVLATIVQATPSEPFRGLQIKWAAIDSGPGAVKHLVRMRDFVYMEATGISRNSAGERVGFHLIHSISIPEVHQLLEYNLVRGSVSHFHLFREKGPRTVELYSKSSTNLLGNVPAPVEMYAACKTMASIERLVECARLKKLSWIYQLVSKSLPVSKKFTRDRSSCRLCQRDLHGENSLRGRTKHCRICLSSICSKCSVSKKLSFVNTLTGRLQQRKMRFCTECTSRAIHSSARQIQLDEIAQTAWMTDFAASHSTWSLSSSESSRDSFQGADGVWTDSVIETPSLSSSRSSRDSFRGI